MLILLNFSDKITGTSKVAEHENWLVCSSMNVAVDREITFPPGANNRELGDPRFDNIRFVKASDISSPNLLRQACVGTGELELATIHFIESANDPVSFEEWELTAPVISTYEQNAGNDGHPQDVFTVNFTKIKVKYVGKDGTDTVAETEAAYDLLTRTAEGG